MFAIFCKKNVFVDPFFLFFCIFRLLIFYKRILNFYNYFYKIWLFL